MSASNRCVICLNYPKSKKKLIPKHSVEEQTLIMYFLRKLAWTPIPEDDLQTFLKQGNPSEWASFCYICEEQVKKCYDMHRKIKEMVDEISEIRRKLYQENFYESDDEDMVDKSSGSCGGGVMNIFNKLREQLFSDFKEEGGNSCQFDNSIMITYKTSSDVEEGTPTATSWKINIVKTEPASEDEDQDNFERIDNESDPDYQEDGDYPSSDSEKTSRAKFQIANTAVGAKPSSSRTKRKVTVDPDKTSGFPEKRQKTMEQWSLVEFSEDKIKEDFRVCIREKLKRGQQTTYYCAYGAPKGKCPVRIKVRVLHNGDRLVYKTINEHCNHRVGIVGLSDEQKQFVNNCIEKGVKGPLDILHSFRDSGVEAPEKGRLQSFLNREKRKLVAIEKALERDPGVDTETLKCQIAAKSRTRKCEDPDYFEANVSDKDYKEYWDNPLDSEETSRAESHNADAAVNAKPSSSKTKIKVEVKPNEILNAKTGLLEKFGEAKWSVVEISEDKIKEDFRVQTRDDLKGGHQTIYYCAYGVPKRKCPVRLRVKLLNNGVRVIQKTNYEHSNHRLGIVGLSDEQKEFVKDCIMKGITKPSDILHSFRESDVEEPDKGRLQSYLNRERNKLIANAKDLKREPADPDNVDQEALPHIK